MDQALQDLGEYLLTALPEEVLQFDVSHGQLNVRVRPDNLLKVMLFVRDDQNCLCKQLMDVTAVDFPSRAERFDVIYNLLSLTLNHRIRLKVATNEDTPLPSVTPVFTGANWFEREVWDLFGILFDEHPDLRRILTDYGFEGHPLRKDFPLTGFVEVRYDEEQKRVIYEPVKLVQEFRTFDFVSPWEGMLQHPGDEKAAD